ncbi:MAG: V-type ATP synthase subunit D [Gammaproteobacteria bacterium]|nr:V-type ATP synthase subunit D [Gammaproteobacteria bacterium]
MNRDLLRIPPTKNTLLSLRKQVKFLEDGRELLERKRELLTRLVYQRIGEYRRQRQLTREAVKEAYQWLSITSLRMGSRALQQVGLGVAPGLRVRIIPKHSLGVEYPAISAEKIPMQPVGLLGTDASLDATRSKMTEAALQLTRLGEAETALGRLMSEQKKARKQVNALKYNIIPRYRNTIAHIESILEEEERNTLFQIQVLRGPDH